MTDAVGDPRAVAAAVAAVPGVVRLTGGALDGIASYLPGERVLGVRLSPERAEVHVVIGVDATVVSVADAVRVAVIGALGRTVPVDVHVDDVDVEHADGGQPALPAASPTTIPTAAGGEGGVGPLVTPVAPIPL